MSYNTMYQTMNMTSNDENNSFTYAETMAQASPFDTLDCILTNIMNSVEYNDRTTTTAAIAAPGVADSTLTEANSTVKSHALHESRQWTSLSNDHAALLFQSLGDISLSSTKFVESRDYVGDDAAVVAGLDAVANLDVYASTEATTAVHQPDWGTLFMDALNAKPPHITNPLPLPRLRSHASATAPLTRLRSLASAASSGQTCAPPSSSSSSSSCDESPSTTKKTRTSTTTNKPKRKRTYKPRKIIPDDKEYVDKYQSNDILCGRGARTNKNPGNIMYLKWIDERKPTYQAAADPEKRKIVLGLLDLIHKHNSRILHLDKDVDRWYVVHEKTAYIKISQALRDKNDAETRAMKRKKYGPSRKKKGSTKKNVKRTTAV